MMRPIAELPASVCKNLKGILTDIDDTLTTDGVVTPDTLQAMHDVRNAGLHLIAITGRPTGWSLPFVHQWPVQAMVTENGAVALLPEADDQVRKIYQQDAPTRQTNFIRMQQVLSQIEAQVPGARRATDSDGRECDIAIDHSEFTHLPQTAIDACLHIMHAGGMRASVSSIHINAWYGEHDKWQGARWIVRELLGQALELELEQWIYIGDSTNDQLMFEHFPYSVGVANIQRFVPQLQHLPRYVTRAERGTGFAEMVHDILTRAHG